jgi:hypothetical protein
LGTTCHRSRRGRHGKLNGKIAALLFSTIQKHARKTFAGSFSALLSKTKSGNSVTILVFICIFSWKTLIQSLSYAPSGMDEENGPIAAAEDTDNRQMG